MSTSVSLGAIIRPIGERLLEFADGRVAFAEPVEQLDSHRLAEHAEALSDELDQRLWQRERDGWTCVVTSRSYHNHTVVELTDRGRMLSFTHSQLCDCLGVTNRSV
jgi:hypothetical protein